MFFQYFKEMLGSLPKAEANQEKPTRGRAKPEKTNPKSLPKAMPDQERSTQDRVRPRKAFPRQGQARKGRLEAGPDQARPSHMAIQVGSARMLPSKLPY